MIIRKLHHIGAFYNMKKIGHEFFTHQCQEAFALQQIWMCIDLIDVNVLLMPQFKAVQ